MAIDRATAEQRLQVAIAHAALDVITLVPVESLPIQPYNFDPHGWWLYTVTREGRYSVDGGEFVAIHPESGEIRHL